MLTNHPTGEWARPPLVLVVDDEQPNVDVLRRLLGRNGLQSVGLTDPRAAVERVVGVRPDLVLLDLHMPGLDGFAVLAALGQVVSRDDFLPVIVLTGDGDATVRHRALAAGATDFITKPLELDEVMLRIRNVLHVRRLHLTLQMRNEELHATLERRTAELDAARLEVLDRLARAAELRDDDTGQHTQRVGRLAARLAEVAGLPAQVVELVRKTAPLHDVGKIAIPDSILLKPGALSPSERAVIQTHTVAGARILAGGSTPLLSCAERIARSHHERWDGAGYPDGLAGEAIPIEARLTSIADVYDALSHARPYRDAWPAERVLEKLRADRGTAFDPQLVDVFIDEIVLRDAPPALLAAS